MRLDDPPKELTAERTVICIDDRIGLRAVIAIDDTTLGPGFGGVRMKEYRSLGSAIEEAQRLAAAMTLKNALAGIPYGGGKSVIISSSEADNRAQLITRFGEFVADLGGCYVPGVDMGTNPADMRAMAAVGASTRCADEDPSPWTALGVFAAIEGAARVHLGASSLEGISVLVQGVGHVGASLARQLKAAGAHVDVSDVDPARAQDLARELGGTAVTPDAVIDHDCDVFAPCAIARVLNEENIPRLQCKVVAGGANDTLNAASDAELLAERGILFVPDFVANSGGVIHVHALAEGWDHLTTTDAVFAIGQRVERLLERARRNSITPVSAAHAEARELLEQARLSKRPIGHKVFAS